MKRTLGAVYGLLLGLLLLSGLAQPLLAGPVDWQEVPVTSEGQQWWDRGSLRLNKNGNLTVLSRFQPPTPEAGADGKEVRPPASSLYVMELDCAQRLYRDTSVNGLPQWGSQWQASANDGLIESTIEAVCAAGEELLAGS